MVVNDLRMVLNMLGLYLLIIVCSLILMVLGLIGSLVYLLYWFSCGNSIVSINLNRII